MKLQEKNKFRLSYYKKKVQNVFKKLNKPKNINLFFNYSYGLKIKPHYVPWKFRGRLNVLNLRRYGYIFPICFLRQIQYHPRWVNYLNYLPYSMRTTRFRFLKSIKGIFYRKTKRKFNAPRRYRKHFKVIWFYRLFRRSETGRVRSYPQDDGSIQKGQKIKRKIRKDKTFWSILWKFNTKYFYWKNFNRRKYFKNLKFLKTKNYFTNNLLEKIFWFQRRIDYVLIRVGITFSLESSKYLISNTAISINKIPVFSHWKYLNIFDVLKINSLLLSVIIQEMDEFWYNTSLPTVPYIKRLHLVKMRIPQNFHFSKHVSSLYIKDYKSSIDRYRKLRALKKRSLLFYKSFYIRRKKFKEQSIRSKREFFNRDQFRELRRLQKLKGKLFLFTDQFLDQRMKNPRHIFKYQEILATTTLNSRFYSFWYLVIFRYPLFTEMTDSLFYPVTILNYLRGRTSYH